MDYRLSEHRSIAGPTLSTDLYGDCWRFLETSPSLLPAGAQPARGPVTVRGPGEHRKHGPQRAPTSPIVDLN